MVINSSTFVENVVLFIRDLVRTKITDPLSRSEGFVMTSYPKRKVDYPIITVKQVNISTTKLGMSSETHLADIALEVRIWSRNAKEADELLSDVINELRDAEYASTGTDAENIFGFSINAVNSLVEVEGDNSVHSKIINLNYRVILS